MATLLDLCEFIVDCEHKTAPLAQSGYPSIRTPNVGYGRLILEGVNRVDEETYQAWSRRATPRANDLIIAREAPLGNVAIVPKGLKVCLGQRTVLVRPNMTKVNPAYLCYFLLGDYAQGLFHGSSIGATVPHLNMKDIRGMPMPELPSLVTQRRIASILSAFDDLLENNTRRIAILEEMARRIYEEWFVHFRFPGHEQVRMVESELGLIPEGWKVSRMSEYCDVTDYVANGSFASLKENVTYRDAPDHAILVRTKDFGSGWGGNFVYVDEASYRFLKKSFLEAGDIVVGNVGNAGMTFRVPDLGQPMTLGPNAITVRPKSSTTYVYQYLCNDIGQHLMRGIVSGAAQPKFNKTEFRKLFLPLPSAELLEKYERIGSRLWLFGETLRKKNANLRTTRDLLLPKLISGELDVSHLPEPEAMAA